MIVKRMRQKKYKVKSDLLTKVAIYFCKCMDSHLRPYIKFDIPWEDLIIFDTLALMYKIFPNTLPTKFF